jgi:hypothetical protein
MIWRFDQGRLEYLNFAAIRAEASALLTIEGAELKGAGDVLRQELPSLTGMAFASGPNKLWRNYKRVFGLAMLATESDGRLVCTDVCRELCPGGRYFSDPDAYFGHFTKRFYFPSPVFEGYETTGRQVFPVCAILKLLAAKLVAGEEPSVTAVEVCLKLAESGMTGTEPLADFVRLRPSRGDSPEPMLRQVRELLGFISQFSFLTWRRPGLFLERFGDPDMVADFVSRLASPVVGRRLSDPAGEILRLGGCRVASGEKPLVIPVVLSADDLGFVEGKPGRVTHLRHERSRKLRDFYFKQKRPCRCDMCSLVPKDRYPWVDGLLELHHLLPLASPARVTAARTALDDLVPLCPNCHRATHSYYGVWLRRGGVSDFASRQQAVECYEQAKKNLIGTC